MIYSIAIVADSFITFPKFPVKVSSPLPLEIIDSINKISPPTRVHARPVTTPAISLFSYLSLSSFGAPNISMICSFDIFTIYFSSIAIFIAANRTIFAICFSNPLTPLSLVYPSIIFSNCGFPSFKSLFVRP